MPRFDAAVLHDYFVDRLVMVADLARLGSTIAEKASEGGGGIHGVRQQEIRGGNAVNLAHSLGRLGTRTFLVTHSDLAHEGLLRRTFEGLDVTLSVKRRDAGLTVAFEGVNRRGRVNLMLGHEGGAGDFPPSLLSRNDWSLIEESRIVCVVNWAANKRGTELLLALRRQLGPEHLIFADPADMRDRIDDYSELLRVIKARRVVDWLSVNEYEARTTAKLLGIRDRDLGKLCLKVARRLDLKVDIHTERGSYTSDGSVLITSKTKWVTPKRLTGAGDVWDAASVHFFLGGRKDSERLALADAAAGYYVSSREPESPNESQLSRLVRPELFLKHS